ncbi:MAG: DUF2460 domain-containing protein [Candidatus Dactylopiibacterium sp.]|nr:DUF2460 domain-containing protein [Candidatus Dactylopiibacterium sp.]
MSNAILPDFPGITIDVQRSAEWNTVIKEAWSGAETRVAQRTWPVWLYSLKIDVLRADVDEINALEAFFNSRAGAWDSFLFRDPENAHVTDQQFGVCDGVATVFQLSRAVGTWIEPVWAPASTPAPVIKHNGTPLVLGTDYSLGANGRVLLASARPSGVLSWTGDYFMRVRFADDKLQLQRICAGLWKVGKVELRSEVYPT